MASTSSWSQRFKSPPRSPKPIAGPLVVPSKPRERVMRSQSLQSLPTSLGSKSTQNGDRNEKLERLRHEALHFGDEKSHESLQSELTRTRNGPFLEELQLVQQRLADRFVKLDEALRSKDLQLEETL
eukprot:symbB.v1.2.027443.t1/scaffold2818.1/size74726/2